MEASTRDKPWLWKPGMSGNPSGRPKGLPRKVRDKYGRKAFALCVAILENRVCEPRWVMGEDGKNRKLPCLPSVSDALSAAKTVMAYCWGQPSQKLEITDDSLPSSLAITFKDGTDPIEINMEPETPTDWPEIVENGKGKHGD